MDRVVLRNIGTKKDGVSCRFEKGLNLCKAVDVFLVYAQHGLPRPGRI